MCVNEGYMRLYLSVAEYTTDLGYRMLQIIREAGETGITRPCIAKAIGKKRLCLWHEAQLQRLETDDLITVSMLQNGQLMPINEFIYRAAQL